MKTTNLRLQNCPFVSVIIPVFNDTEALARNLSRLSEQTYPAQNYEVIVVDNNSTEDLSGVSNQFKQVVFTSETSIGSYAARNKGISLAKGSLFAFIDSDCLPAKDWIEQGVSALVNILDTGLVGGAVVFSFSEPDHISALEIYDSITHFNMKKNIEEHHFTGTGNLFVSRKVMDAVGWFNDALKSGGDREWGNRAYAKGFQLVFSEKTVVSHPARNSYREVFTKARRIAGGLHTINSTTVKSQPFVKRVLPPAKRIIHVFNDRRVPTLVMKIKVIMIVVAVKYISLIEEIRLNIGGSTKRS